MNRGIAYIVFSNWRTGDSGLDTFVRHMAPLFGEGRIEGELVEIAYGDYDRRDPAEKRQRAATRSAGATPAGSVLRLAAAYVKRVGHDLAMLWPLRGRLRGRRVLTNQFGCETLPIALRLLFPLHRVAAICHTHPPVQSHPGAVDRFRRGVERTVYRCVDDVVYNSASVREEWRKRLNLKEIKGDVIWYGIDAPDETLPADYPPKPVGAIDVVCVSRFVKWKGHKELIKAFARAREKALDGEQRTSDTSPLPMRLILVGNGPTWRECIRYARELGLDPYVTDMPDMRKPSVSNPSGEGLSAATPAHRPSPQNQQIPESSNPLSPLPNAPINESTKNRPSVFFLGRRPDGATYFNGADVVVQLSTEPEAFGIVLLEAMSRGKPVLASRVGGIPEIVADGETGVLVDPADADGVAGALGELASQSGLRQAMGAAGRNRWRKWFTVERMRSAYVAGLVAKRALG